MLGDVVAVAVPWLGWAGERWIRWWRACGRRRARPWIGWRLEKQIAVLSGELAAGREVLARLRITRETVAEVLAEAGEASAGDVSAAGKSDGAPLKAVVPQRGPGPVESELPPAYQQVMQPGQTIKNKLRSCWFSEGDRWVSAGQAWDRYFGGRDDVSRCLFGGGAGCRR